MMVLCYTRCTTHNGKIVMGRRMTKADIVSAIRSQNILNSMMKRGEVDLSGIRRTHYVVCGCGEEGCGFISLTRNSLLETAQRP